MFSFLNPSLVVILTFPIPYSPPTSFLWFLVLIKYLQDWAESVQNTGALGGYVIILLRPVLSSTLGVVLLILCVLRRTSRQWGEQGAGYGLCDDHASRTPRLVHCSTSTCWASSSDPSPSSSLLLVDSSMTAVVRPVQLPVVCQEEGVFLWN